MSAQAFEAEPGRWCRHLGGGWILLLLIADAAILLVLALGQTFVVITLGIDLSVGSVLVFASVIGARLMLSFRSGSTIAALIAQSPKQEGALAMDVAAKLIAGHTVAPTAYSDIAVIRDGDNAKASADEYKADCSL
jgi:hypothetical protein